MNDGKTGDQFMFPNQLGIIKENLLEQEIMLRKVATLYANAIESGGLVHVYANGHSRLSVEEMVVRMGALSGFHPILSNGLTSFTDVIGPSGLRVNQFYEKIEGIGAQLLDEVDFGEDDVFLIITATGTTIAAVDVAIEFTKRYPQLPIIGLASKRQSQDAKPHHSSGKNLWHVIQGAEKGYFIDNGMPMGDVSVSIDGQTGKYSLCPLSSIGALSVVQALNELTIRELDSRNHPHFVLQNMHIKNTQNNYEAWLRDQRKRYAKATYNKERVIPKS